MLAALALATGAGAARDLPAFPGAQGFGATTPGGRGGQTILVTNLQDAGPGSLREACSARGPRMVVFRVGGIIDLRSPLRITEPYVTLAGQSAPGGGICLRGYNLEILTHDVVVRFLRSRPGAGSGQAVDAISIGSGSRNVILDHCSASWSVDEALSPSGAIQDITVQWCLISEALNRSVHPKGPHGYGSLVRAAGGVSLHHNLWAHNDSRNPRLGDNYGRPPYPTFDVRNNVMYDYGAVCSGMTGNILNVNYIANYIKPGPSSQRRPPIVFTNQADAKYFVAGNVVAGQAEWSADNTQLFDRTTFEGRRLVTIVPEPFAVPEVATSPAEAALELVLSRVGAVLPVRDEVDARVVGEVRAGTGRIIDSPQQVGGWPVYRSGRPPADRDGDGMPDAWEKAHGLNPRDPSDAVQDRDGDGYTNLEEYLNELARGK
jgi:pectate lyase